MKKESRRTSKYLLLALILIAVFVLPGCRTRLTNNSEVSNIQYDEDGYMSDMYQMRRDELGLSTAERPLLPDFGSGETDENDDFGEGEEINYNPEDYQEDFSEPQTNTNTNTNTNTTTRTRNRDTRTPRNNSNRGENSGSGSNSYIIEFDANGGKFEDGSDKFGARVPKGDKIGKHFPNPNPTKEGFEFDGWRAKAGGENGTPVSPDQVINKSTTLIARWKAPETKPKYKISFDYKGGDVLETDRKREEGKPYGTLPAAKWKGHHFEGWYDGKGNRIEANQKVTASIILHAKWTDWKTTYSDAKKNTKEKTCFVVGDITYDEFIKDCNLKYAEDASSADCIIAFVTKTSDAEQISKEYPGIQVIALNEEAITSTDEYDSLLYKIVILNEIHGQKLKLAQAQDDIKKEADFKTAKTDKPDTDPDPDPDSDPTPDPSPTPDPETQTEP